MRLDGLVCRISTTIMKREDIFPVVAITIISWHDCFSDGWNFNFEEQFCFHPFGIISRDIHLDNRRGIF